MWESKEIFLEMQPRNWIIFKNNWFTSGDVQQSFIPCLIVHEPLSVPFGYVCSLGCVSNHLRKSVINMRKES
jgi:hypothetical protein